MKRIKNPARWIWLALTVALCTMIFCMSAQDAQTSSQTSGGLIELIVSRLLPGFPEMSPAEQTAIVASYQHLARKAAHFSIYLLLGVTTFGTVSTFSLIRRRMQLLCSLEFCLLYAASDELHQLYVPGRSGQIRDVLLDFAGSLVGVALLWLLLVLMSRMRRRKAA